MKGIYMRFGLLIICTVVISCVFFGCTQKNDIITPIERSVLTLNPQNLPTPPAGLIYELWISKETVVDTAFDLSQATSLGRFSYISNDSIKTFTDDSGSVRTAVFNLSADFQTYRSVFVGLHRTTDAAGIRPGAIMLIAYIPGALDVPIRMVFPQHDSLWESTCLFNLEGISDRDRSQNDGRGIWFSSYRSSVLSMPDTTALTVDSSRTVTIEPIIGGNPPDTLNDSILKAQYLVAVQNVRAETRRVTFPNDTMILIDSFMHTGIKFDKIFRADSSYPYTKRVLTFTYTTAPKSVTLDIFSQDELGLPVVSEWGWKYAGWALTPHVVPNARIGALTPPTWPLKTYDRPWISGSDSGWLIPTGTFSDINAPDDANPFALGSYLPPFPGEDFLNSATMTDSLGIGSLNLMPTTSGNKGSILITMEPNNRLATNTNFPLIAFIGPLPDRRDSLSAPLGASIHFNMLNATSTLLGNQVNSFPMIVVKIERF